MIPNNSIIVSSTEPTGKKRKKVWMQKGKNLFNKNNVFTYADYFYIKVQSGIQYSIQIANNNRFTIKASATEPKLDASIATTGTTLYDGGTLTVDGSINTKTIIMPDNNQYLIIRYNSSADTSIFETIQIEQGPIATEKEAYIEPKIYVKNGNDVYEEFISKDNLDNYLTREKRIGTWTDGKPLYRKVQDVVLENNSGDVGLSGGNIQNVDKVINIYGIIPYSSTSNSKVPINSYIDNTHYSSFYFFKSQNVLRAFIGSAFAGLTANVIVEYTKTTD